MSMNICFIKQHLYTEKILHNEDELQAGSSLTSTRLDDDIFSNGGSKS